MAVAGVLVATAAALWLIYRLSNILFMVFVSVFVAVAIEPAGALSRKEGLAAGSGHRGCVLGRFRCWWWSSSSPWCRCSSNRSTNWSNAAPDYVTTLAQFIEDTFGVQLSDPQVQEEGQNLADLLTGAGGTVLGGVIGITTGVFNFLFFAATVGDLLLLHGR